MELTQTMPPAALECNEAKPRWFNCRPTKKGSRRSPWSLRGC